MLQKGKNKFSMDAWKRINMRNVNHLLGVEFIHNLYNRHLPRINSIRFRNTVTFWEDGRVNSYAPKEEWDVLADWFGKKFLKLDKRLLEQVNNLLNFDRDFYNNFILFLKNLNLENLNNIELGLALIDIQDYTLGELYQVNLVQIEHALTSAIRTLLQSHTKDLQKRNELFCRLIVANTLTEAQKEEIEFNKIVKLGKNKKVKDPVKNKRVLSLVKNHHDKYAFMYCAYGELPRDISFYLDKYKKLFYKKLTIKEEIIKVIDKRYAAGLKLLNLLRDKKLKVLVPLMVRVGVFRDYNKAQLGQTIKYKLKVLDEIAKRGLEKRKSLNYYLLHELLNLLEKGEKVNKGEIRARIRRGVVLVRAEYLEINKTRFGREMVNLNNMRGICASPGEAIGECKIVLHRGDVEKIKKGDIMVAIGTDFDLMEAIQRSRAVITEEGGLLSHAAVVCREMSKPCCIGVLNATKKLKDGMKIKVDANNGFIHIQ